MIWPSSYAVTKQIQSYTPNFVELKRMTEISLQKEIVIFTESADKSISHNIGLCACLYVCLSPSPFAGGNKMPFHLRPQKS